MAASLEDGSEPSVPANGEGVVHNNVLIRTHKSPRESHAWVAPTLLGVALVAGAVIWGVVATHPSGPVVNHAVAAAPTSFAPSANGG